MIPAWRQSAPAGLSLKAAQSAGPRPIATRRSPSPSVLPPGITDSLSRVLRPQAAYRWLLPQLAAITPQYIEMTLRGALAGNHVQAWELFDLMEDTWPRLVKDLNEIKRAVCGMNWKIMPYKIEGQAPTPEAELRAKVVAAAFAGMRPDVAADENDFAGMVYDLLDAWAKGQVVQEVEWQNLHTDFGDIIAPRATYWVHPVCVSWNMEGRLGLRLEVFASQQGRIGQGGASPKLIPGVWQTTTLQPRPTEIGDFPPHKFLVGIHKAKSGTALSAPLLRSLAWWWCAANFSSDWLMNLASIFGLPFRWANYDPSAPQETIDEICDLLQNMGTSAWAAFPAGTTMEFKEPAKGAEDTPQADLLDRADRNCDLLILGQNLTSEAGDSGGSRAMGEVHERGKWDIIQEAANFAAGEIRDQLVRSILILNFGDDDLLPTYDPAPKEEKDAKAYADRDAVLLDRGVKMPLGWFYKRHDIPEPLAGEAVVASSRSAPPPQAVPPVPEQPAADQPGTGSDAAIQARAPSAPTPAPNPNPTPNPDLSAANTLLAEAVAAEWHHVMTLLDQAAAIEDPAVRRRQVESALAQAEAVAKHAATGPVAAAISKIVSTGLAQGLSTANAPS